MKILFGLCCLVLAAALIVPWTGSVSDTREQPGNRSGELEYPMVRGTTSAVPVFRAEEERETERTPRVTPTVTRTPTPTMPPTTIPPTTIPPTTRPPTQSATPPTTIPVVTVTVYVPYPSGPVYSPVYYYPPGYPYAITSYYPSGSLVVTSNPSNAIVILDGYTTQTTPYVFTNLVPGYHSVEVDYPGYEAYMTSVYIDSAESEVVNARLVPLISYGSLFVDSSPRGADVYVDGNYEGTTAVTVSGLSAGPHRLELHLAGYEVLTRTIDISSGQGNNLNLALIPYTASTATGSIDIRSNVPGALVYLDGIYKGSVPTGSVFNIIAVSPGSHTILLHVPGYTDFTQTVQVDAGRIADVNAVFTQSPSGQQGILPQAGLAGGSILVSSVPSGGQVWVDDQFRGVTPVTIYNMAPGSHIVNMKLAGYSDWSTSVQVQSGQVVQVPATFTPGAGAVPTRAGLPAAVILAGLGIAVFIAGKRRKR